MIDHRFQRMLESKLRQPERLCLARPIPSMYAMSSSRRAAAANQASIRRCSLRKYDDAVLSCASCNAGCYANTKSKRDRLSIPAGMRPLSSRATAFDVSTRHYFRTRTQATLWSVSVTLAGRTTLLQAAVQSKHGSQFSAEYLKPAASLLS